MLLKQSDLTVHAQARLTPVGSSAFVGCLFQLSTHVTCVFLPPSVLQKQCSLFHLAHVRLEVQARVTSHLGLAVSNAMCLVCPGCPAVLLQSHSNRQLAFNAYAEEVAECSASFACAIQPICLAGGALHTAPLQVTLHAVR